MIVACHQPNFAPHPAYFAKIKEADVFTLSDSVLMSNRAFFNYNYLKIGNERKKVTVPVHRAVAPLKSIELCDWEHNRQKLIKTIEQAYSKRKYFNEFFKPLQEVLLSPYKTICELNIELIKLYMGFLSIPLNKLMRESDLGIDFKNPNDDIISICKKLGADCYLSGAGGHGYLDKERFDSAGVSIKFVDYPAGNDDLSIIDYCFRNGGVL